MPKMVDYQNGGEYTPPTPIEILGHPDLCSYQHLTSHRQNSENYWILKMNSDTHGHAPLFLPTPEDWGGSSQFFDT